MSNLEEFYANRQMMAKYFSEAELKQKEEELLQGELAAAVSQSVTQVLAGVRSPIRIMIDHDPQDGTIVKIARKDTPSVSLAVNVPSTSFSSEPSVEEEHTTGKHSSRVRSNGFTVRFPDGTEVRRKNAKETMIATLKVIGMHRMAAEDMGILTAIILAA